MGTLRTGAALALSLGRATVARARRGPLHPAWSLWAEALFSHLRRELAPLLSLSPEAQRAHFEKLVLPSPALQLVQRTPFAPPAPRAGVGRALAGEWLTPSALGDSQRTALRGESLEPAPRAAARTVLYLHGGGYVTGSLRTYADLAARLALAAGARLLLLDYRLAPEHPLPAALDDALAAVRWLRESGAAMGQLILAGDSAGGALALSTLVALRDAGEPLPAGALLICPWVDLEMKSASVAENAPFDALDAEVARSWRRHYLGPVAAADPRASPVHADLRGLPPLCIQVGSAELLRDEGSLLARRARESGVRVDFSEWPGMVHDWHLLAQVFAPAREAIARLGAFVRETTERPQPVDAAGGRTTG
jgi:monoterpene epsilon-lactone hydrolase